MPKPWEGSGARGTAAGTALPELVALVKSATCESSVKILLLHARHNPRLNML